MPQWSNRGGAMENQTLSHSGPITWDDATWILTSSFIIFTMQSGFGLLEAGMVATKNEVNIMVKNAVDVIFGGLSYWAFGYALTFGDARWSNPFCGVGSFFVNSDDINKMGLLYSNFIFQLSFATTATTIVSGAMAERTKLVAYIIFSFLNTIMYCVPAHWLWAHNGFLRTLGTVDIAGSGAVHLLGGTSALVATVMLGPRLGRYRRGTPGEGGGEGETGGMDIGNPTNSLIGLFMLWWGWLAFNSGSTYGISGGKWILASRACVTTITASMGGGMVGIILSYIRHARYNIEDLINSILGSLVGVTGACAIIQPWEGLIIGTVSGIVCQLGPRLLHLCRVDDPVGAVSVHGLGGLWGCLAVGIFARLDPIEDLTMGREGLIWGGSPYLLGVQCLAILCIIAWSGGTTLIILSVLKFTIGIRLNETEEILGSDFVEHGINHSLPGVPTQLIRPFPSVRKRLCSSPPENGHGKGSCSTPAETGNYSTIAETANSTSMKYASSRNATSATGSGSTAAAFAGTERTTSVTCHTLGTRDSGVSALCSCTSLCQSYVDDSAHVSFGTQTIDTAL